MEWFIPVVSVLFYVIMVEVPLGSTVYVGKSICLILGILLMIIGNYIPKMSYEMSKTTFHPMPKSEKSFRKMSKIMGYSIHCYGNCFTNNDYMGINTNLKGKKICLVYFR